LEKKWDGILWLFYRNEKEINKYIDESH